MVVVPPRFPPLVVSERDAMHLNFISEEKKTKSNQKCRHKNKGSSSSLRRRPKERGEREREKNESDPVDFSTAAAAGRKPQ